MLVTPLLGGRRPCTGSWVLSGNVPAQLGGGTSTVASTAPQWPTLRLLPAPPDPRLHHGGVPPKPPTASYWLRLPPWPSQRGWGAVTMVTNEVPRISSLRGLGELSNRAGPQDGWGGRARRTPRCPRAPTPPLEVVAESLAPGPQTRPLAVPVRHQGLGRPLEAAFHCQATSAPGLGFWSKQVKTVLRKVCSESVSATNSLVS